MKDVKKVLFIFSLTILILISKSPSFATERSIYVGDLIELKITTQEFTEDEVREKFKDFEIVELKIVSDGFLVTIRTFEIGEKVINLGNGEIIINVKSTMEEIDRNELFEGDTNPENPGFSIYYNLIFYILVLASFVTGGVLLVNYIKKRKALPKSPYQRFVNRIEKISFDDGKYLVTITRCLKEYLELRFMLHIRGKTSTEIINEISKVKNLQPVPGKINDWLREMDHCKFSGDFITKVKKQELLSELKDIVSDIEKSNEGREC